VDCSDCSQGYAFCPEMVPWLTLAHRSAPQSGYKKTLPARIHIRIRIGSSIHSFSHLHTQFIHTPEELEVLPFITWAWLNRKYKTDQGQWRETGEGAREIERGGGAELKEQLKGPSRIPGPHWISSEMNSCSYPATKPCPDSLDTQRIYIKIWIYCNIFNLLKGQWINHP